MATVDDIDVEVVVATPDRQAIVQLAIRPGTTAAEAIAKSGLVASFPELDFAASGIAIWGKCAESGAILQSGDRVEILRPLLIDPRDARRELAEVGQNMGGPGPPDA